jgi:hypothetical protein
MPARDERIFCEAEQARSQGKRGDRQACEAKQKLRWSRRNNSFTIQKPENPFLTLRRHSVGLVLDRHKNCMVVVTMKVKSSI